MQVKKNPKADLGRNSMIFFQVGLVVMLGLTYFGLEWKFYGNEEMDHQEVQVSDFEQEDIPITQLNTPPPPPPPPPPPMPEVIEVVEDQIEVEETKIRSTESSQDDKIEKIVEVEEIAYEEEEEEIEKVPFMVVQQIPTFPGCENIKNKADQKKCMSQKIDDHVKKHFDVRISEELGLTGMNRIYVVFKINEHGDVADIRARGPNKRLEEEAMRVVNLLPKMIPGRQRDKPVAVEYSLPIMYEIRDRI
ncbi:energy transducer TonB [Salinimicrobium sediminilitoris]|uniref:energy transducer TonB n=1 Tax=Salinimicrobium sediminilitoris TaxID=2876715 RepID=UPI001E4D6621|nr:energy transducer TonB [Salinimicrobium sediminilitoris]MCC8360201.1 energy transducer TonB [Salinimicrobium sediminilitoris]